jgi:hypothetical protein
VIQTFLQSLHRNTELFECIVNLSGGSVRAALQFVNEFFGSGHVDAEKIVRLSTHGGYTIPVHEFLRAIIFGDSRYYHPERSPVTNLFDVSLADPHEHFICPSLLAILQNESGRSAEHGFIPTALVHERLRGGGYSEGQITWAISRSLLRKLVESSTRQISRPGVTAPPSLRITMLGAYHVERLLKMFTYVDAVIVDTPIFSENPEPLLTDPKTIDQRLDRVILFKKYLDNIWSQKAHSRDLIDWASIGASLENDVNKIRLRTSSAKWLE